MNRRGFRIRLGATVVAAVIGSGAALTLPAHAGGLSCTSNTGLSLCATTFNTGESVGAIAYVGTAPDSSNAIGAAVDCRPGGIDVAPIVNGQGQVLTVPVGLKSC